MPGSLLLCWKRQRQRVAALGSQDPLRRQADRGPASAGRERHRPTRRPRPSDRSSTGVRLPEHGAPRLISIATRKGNPRPAARRTAGTWDGERLGSNLGEASARQGRTQPIGIPAPYGRVPRAVIRDCSARHPWRLVVERPGHRCRHWSTQQWHGQQTSSTSSRRSCPSRAYVRWCTVTVAGPPPCRTRRRWQRAERQSLVTNQHERRARQNGEPRYSS